MQVSDHAKERLQERVQRCYWRKFSWLVYTTMKQASRVQGDKDYAVAITVNNQRVGYAVCRGTLWITTLGQGKTPMVHNIYRAQA